jgi:WD40 repeat protein
MMRRSGLRPAMSQPPKDVKRFSLLDFTPDGREVVYQNRAGLLVATHVSTGEQRSLFDCGKDPCFADVSPDGDRLAIGADAGLQVVDLATGDAVTLVAEGGSAPVVARGGHHPLFRNCCGGWTPPSVVWAPDGGQVLFGSNRHPTRAYTSDGERIENPGSLPQLLGSATWQPLHEATDD